MAVYEEDLKEEFGVTHQWDKAIIRDSFITERGTKVEIIERPRWGLACYMDNSIQSCIADEKIYHESLVHPIMITATERKRVMIIGGGEGATAREVLKWSDVEMVDMYEWDKDVVSLFRDKYSQWGQGAWNDSRLRVIYDDIFTAITCPPLPHNRYDIIIIDLFEPCEDNRGQWLTLIKSLHKWITTGGSIVMYAGMRNILAPIQPYEQLITMIGYNVLSNGIITHDMRLSNNIIPYRVYIPSFSGESTFILLKGAKSSNTLNTDIKSHIADEIWRSYISFNW